MRENLAVVIWVGLSDCLFSKNIFRPAVYGGRILIIGNLSASDRCQKILRHTLPVGIGNRGLRTVFAMAANPHLQAVVDGFIQGQSMVIFDLLLISKRRTYIFAGAFVLGPKQTITVS